MKKIPVRIDSSCQVFIEADAATFADIFANAHSEEQAEILRLCLETVRKKYPAQMDYISIELEKPEYAETRELLRYIIESE